MDSAPGYHCDPTQTHEPQFVCGQLRFENRFALPLSELGMAKDVKKEKEKLFELARAYYLYAPLEKVVENMHKSATPDVMPSVSAVMRHADSGHELKNRIAGDLWLRNAALMERYDGFRLVSSNRLGRNLVEFLKEDGEVLMEVLRETSDGSLVSDRFDIGPDATVRHRKDGSGASLPVFDPCSKWKFGVIAMEKILLPVSLKSPA